MFGEGILRGGVCGVGGGDWGRHYEEVEEVGGMIVTRLDVICLKMLGRLK